MRTSFYVSTRRAVGACALFLGVTVLPFVAPACTRREDAPAPTPSAADSVDEEAVTQADPSTLPQAQVIGALVGKVQASAIPSASALAPSAPIVASSAPSSSASVPASASIAPSSSASNAPSATPALPRAAALTQMIGAWGFSRFDLDDAGTKARWMAVPADLQKEILKSAPEAWLFVAKDTMITRLNGVPEKKSTYTVEAESAGFPAGTVVVHTNDEGRKAIRLLDADTMRVEDLDKKASFVTIFARKKTK